MPGIVLPTPGGNPAQKQSPLRPPTPKAPSAPPSALELAATRIASRNRMPAPPKPSLRYKVPTGVMPLPPANTSVGVSPAGVVPALPSNYGDLFNAVMRKAMQLYNSNNPAGKSLLGVNAIMGNLPGAVIDPNQVAQDAGLSYAAQIDQLNKNLGTTKAQNAQNLVDIGDWFNQVKQAQNEAAASNASELAAQLAGQNDAAKGFLNAIGNGASGGAAGIANASDIASAGLRGIGQSQSNFDSDMKGIIALDQAQQLQNERAAGNKRIQDLLDQITQAKGAQGAAEAQARDNANQQRFSQLSSLAQLKANLQGNLFNERNSLRSQKLSELGGLSNTILGAALAGPQIQGAELNNQLQAGNVAARTISNKGLSAQVAQVVNQNGGAGSAPITALPPGTRAQVQSMLTAKGGQYVNASGGLTMSPQMVKASVLSQLTNGMGFARDPQLLQFVNDTLNQVLTPKRVTAWRKQHGG